MVPWCDEELLDQRLDGGKGAGLAAADRVGDLVVHGDLLLPTCSALVSLERQSSQGGNEPWNGQPLRQATPAAGEVEAVEVHLSPSVGRHLSRRDRVGWALDALRSQEDLRA